MKFEPYENCLISEDRRVLKADTVEQLPEKLKMSFPRGFTDPEYMAKKAETNLYSDPYAIDDHYNPKNEVEGTLFERGYPWRQVTVVNKKTLKHFLQKSSVFYFNEPCSPLLIQNKNYVVIISPCNVGKYIRTIEDRV